MPTLADLTVGARGRVLGFEKGASTYRKKLMAMGLTPGTEFTVTRLAPLGDPVEIRVRGFALTLRKDEANSLRIEAMT
ncbi:MAG: FeoA family protein [Gammaproteobacteria bacterium]|jgi:ferrous iron transport protein A